MGNGGDRTAQPGGVRIGRGDGNAGVGHNDRSLVVRQAHITLHICGNWRENHQRQSIDTIKSSSGSGWPIITGAILGSGLVGGLVGGLSVILDSADLLLTAVYVGAAVLAATGLFWLGMMTRQAASQKR